VTSHDHKRRRFASAKGLTPEQVAAIRRLACGWRDNWRAEIAARNGAATNAPAQRRDGKSSRPAKTQQAGTTRFANAIARDEFGRFYWSGEQAKQLAQALNRKAGRKQPGAAKRRP
jgi:hypothetical protein